MKEKREELEKLHCTGVIERVFEAPHPISTDEEKAVKQNAAREIGLALLKMGMIDVQYRATKIPDDGVKRKWVSRLLYVHPSLLPDES